MGNATKIKKKFGFVPVLFEAFLPAFYSLPRIFASSFQILLAFFALVWQSYPRVLDVIPRMTRVFLEIDNFFSKYVGRNYGNDKNQAKSENLCNKIKIYIQFIENKIKIFG